MKYSARMDEVKPSATLAITSKAKALRASGEDVIILAAGEPDFDTPEEVKKAAIEAVNSGDTKYTPAGGRLSLKEAIKRKFKDDNSLDYDVSEIVVSSGAKHSLYNIFQVICNDGDEVIIIHPYWVSYPEMVRLAGGVPKFVKTSAEKGFKAGEEDILSAVSGRTKALVINSPSNPCGAIYSREDLRKIAKICIEKDILIISDEIYEKIIFDGQEHASIASISPEVKAKTIVVNGVSKSFSMTGWRIGYMAGDKEMIKKVNTLQSHSTSNPCSISQAAAEYAISKGLTEEMERNCSKFQERRDVLMKGLLSIDKAKPFKPEGAFYFFCDISGYGLDSMTFAERLLDEAKVAVIPGAPFGDDRFIRISFATDVDTIKKGITRIKEWAGSL
ncbi:MAG: pyridoxal phosphate-dependent aminotransferase [Candidatus Omnitrophica bacterium]|nr:pyridoxal phosphate-dependent aminotransferase [Candidatus Omnitrophota bacterium]